MRTTEQLMKACQIGCSNLNDANSLLAECYGRLGRLNEENERMRNDAERIEWQPIETAPKDGTDILVMTGETMHVVRWINIHGDFDYWAVDDNKHGPFTLRGKAPTHWMSLPEPTP